MPLDRRIVVSFSDQTRNVWAELRQDEVARELDAAGRGVYGVGQRVYRIRYWPELAAAVAAGESATVQDGIEVTVQSVGEPDDGGRRRFLDVLIRGRS